MVDKIYPFNINPTDILIQNENGGGMLMNDQFISIVSNMLSDEKKLLDGQNNTDAVNVQTNKFSSGIFITNGNNENPTPVNDLASNNFDSLSPANDNVVLPNQNIIPTPSISILTTPTPQPTPQTTPQPSPSPLTSEEIEEGLYEANFLPAQEASGFDLFSLEDLDTELAPEITISSNNETSVATNVSYNNINTSKNGSTPANFLPKNSSGAVSPYYNFLAAAKNSIGTSTKGIPGVSSRNPKTGVIQPAGKGCGAGVSIMYLRATGHGINYKKPPTPGKDINLELGTVGVYNLISKDTINWKQRDDWKNAQPGDIIVTVTKSKSGHIGFVIDTKTGGAYDIVSNSSSKGELTSYYNINRWSSIANRSGVGPTYAFQFIGKFTDPGKTI